MPLPKQSKYYEIRIGEMRIQQDIWQTYLGGPITGIHEYL